MYHIVSRYTKLLIISLKKTNLIIVQTNSGNILETEANEKLAMK